MRGTSSVSLDAVMQDVQSRLVDGIDLESTADELFSLVDAIDSSNQLVRVLSDAGREAEVKQEVVRSLFASQVSEVALFAVLDVAAHHWSEQNDVLRALEQVGVSALLDQADKDGVLEQVEIELFQISRIIEANGQLASALNDPGGSAGIREGIVRQLFEGRVHPTSLTLAARAAEGAGVEKAARRLLGFAEFASERRRRSIAIVTSARPLSEAQQSRLAQILTGIYGRQVQLNLDVSDSVVGGLRIQVGDDLYDATLLARLSEARSRLAA